MKLTVSLQIVLLVTVDVASSAAEVDEPSHPGESLDATGNPTNQTDISRMSEGKAFISIRSSIIERGVCEMTDSCKRAGGHCIKHRNECSGAVNKRTCIGRKCWCCMPDVEKGCSPTHSCCSAGGHCVKKDADCRGGVLDRRGCRGNEGCQCCLPPAPTSTTTYYLKTTTTEETVTTTTYEPTTTPTNDDLPWVYLEDEAFVPFDESMTWSVSKALCRSYGLDLYHPNNISFVAEHLKSNNYAPYFWLGARGNGSEQLWFDGEIIHFSEVWYSSLYNVGTNDCTAMVTTHADGVKPPAYIFAHKESCSANSLPFRPLCG